MGEDREKRLAEQLRRNLQRRKRQARSRREEVRNGDHTQEDSGGGENAAKSDD